MRSETSFELDGDLIVVDAIVVGPAGRASVQLIVDTGAALSVLGMNFLLDYNIEIRPAERRIIVERI